MKIKRTVEVEVSGPELWAMLREQAGVTGPKVLFNRFALGDIVLVSTDEDDGSYRSRGKEAVITDISASDDDEDEFAYEYAFFDEDGDLEEGYYSDLKGAQLVDRLKDPASGPRPSGSGGHVDFTGQTKNPGF